MAEIKITKENYEKEILQANEPVLVDLWASWCGPCRMLSPVVSRIAQEYEGRAKVAKINVDDEPELAAAFKVAGIPLLVVMKDGKEVNRAVGFRDAGSISEMLNKEL